ncbi:HTH-type transcriptional activator Btr [Maioricimonas rarisocia]|uniref:HTH-type transcriptional activator Btr n=1 Tax=Maioricimonas rarisocia TaxID=2528026 RepID=A0A517ZAT0_9PLAN|nr:AraC family transcriptional regulator [Maioricimonas rarisocia]QDU39557.1 HTH-type transcriptional activator Btr [Maioricimonas rarisocia]
MMHEFLSRLETPFTGEELFDHLPDIVYFIKNRRGEYLVVNRTLAARCGVVDKQDVIGRTASQLLPPPLGDRFSDQDQRVIASGQPLLSQLELHVYATGDVGWCVTTKLPLHEQGGAIMGLVGFSKDLQLPDYEADEYRHVAEAIRHAEEHLSVPPSVGELAEIAGMSRYQLDRRMRRVFGLTTGQWLMKVRIDLARRLLRETDRAMVAIAQEAGYSDQSAFTRQFRKATGLSPREYRLARRSLR